MTDDFVDDQEYRELADNVAVAIDTLSSIIIELEDVIRRMSETFVLLNTNVSRISEIMGVQIEKEQPSE